MNELMATPQVFIIGSLKDATNFGKKILTIWKLKKKMQKKNFGENIEKNF